MPDSSAASNIYHIALGRSFANDFIQGFFNRFGDDPRAIAQAEIFVSSGRMADQVKVALRAHGPAIWPKIRLINDLSKDPRLVFDLPPARSTLERELELAQLVGQLGAQTGALSARAARFALSQSLDAILSEFQRAGLSFAALDEIDLSSFAEHWTLSKNFLSLIAGFLDADAPKDEAARQRHAIAKLQKQWSQKPVDHPVIVAGSTGSREDTILLMQAVAQLPKGMIVLPGFDTDLPENILRQLGDDSLPSDHPQSALAKTLEQLGASSTAPWIEAAVNADRNALMSLVLTPAPVTDRWRQEGPKMSGRLEPALQGMELLEAATPREEALSIALRIREALEQNQTTTLVTPDRVLARQVTSELNRWGIKPDDSAGRPLQQTPPGIFLRLIGKCMGKSAEAIDAVNLLKHPLALAREGLRGEHLLRIRQIEAKILRAGPPHIQFEAVTDWIAKNEPDWADWWQWITEWFESAAAVSANSLSGFSSAHFDLAARLSGGPDAVDTPEVWRREAGKRAEEVLGTLSNASDAAGDIAIGDWLTLLTRTLADTSVLDTEIVDPRVAIWGTLEARNIDSDLVILCGLNEGTWPALPKPNPWLSRPMRKSIGLQSPERAVGLSAHDFLQGASAAKVVISRALRDGDAPTVPSRWVLRLTNLLEGLEETGKSALAQMRARGQIYVDWARQMDRPKVPVPKAPRPAPNPPISARPKELPVTRIQDLIRDPYTIYARYILRLRRLDPLGRVPDAMVRGTALHKVVESFAKAEGPKNRDALIDISAEVLREAAPWPVSFHQWVARVDRISDWLIDLEAEFAASETIENIEEEGRLEFPLLNFTLTARPDRINHGPNGLRVIDYKTGDFPKEKEVRNFDKQLPLTKLIAEAGGFAKIGKVPVAALTYISLKASRHDLDWSETGVDTITQDFQNLIAAYHEDGTAYTARTRPKFVKYASDYEQLSRFGEWEDRDPPEAISL